MAGSVARFSSAFGLLCRQRLDVGLGQGKECREIGRVETARVGGDVTFHDAAGHFDAGDAGECEGGWEAFGADAEEVAPCPGGAAEHVLAPHQAGSAEHALFGKGLGAGESRTEAVGEGWVVGHRVLKRGSFAFGS